MRKAARTDGNQAAIVDALRKAGASVQSLAALGKGVPDLLICYRNTLFLVELKNPKQKPSKRKLTSDQISWHSTWKGTIYVAETAEQVFAVIGANCSTSSEITVI